MISRISISGFSLLRDVTVELGPGLTVLTGESGAGKSLLFDAVAFAMGGRPHRSLLAAGVKRCEVELQLKLTVAAAGILGTPWVSGTNCLVRRYTAAGRSRIQANGEQISVADAQAVGERIFEITGQFESRMLFNPDSHLALLEAFASDELAGLLSDYHTAYRRWRGVCTRLAARQASSSQRKQELDYLQFQVAELGDAAIEVGERSTVEAELTVLENAQALRQAAAEAAQLLDGDDDAPGAYDLAARAEVHLQELSQLLAGVESSLVDPEELTELATGLLAGLRDLAGRCRDVAEAVQHNPGALEQLRERLDELQRLERKYDCTADELVALLAEKEERLAVLADDSQSPEALQRQAAEAEVEVRRISAGLTTVRRQAAQQAQQSTAGYFSRLDFPQVELQVELEELAQPGPEGMDCAELLIALNPGEPAHPLARVASGGEASRLLLGLKAALADRLGYGAVLLDEVEAGVGGETARKVADVLVELAAGRQVLAITHLPVVAARGAVHLLARKQVAQGRTTVEIAVLPDGGRRMEIARMLGNSGGAEEAALVSKLLGEAK